MPTKSRQVRARKKEYNKKRRSSALKEDHLNNTEHSSAPKERRLQDLNNTEHSSAPKERRLQDLNNIERSSAPKERRLQDLNNIERSSAPKERRLQNLNNTERSFVRKERCLQDLNTIEPSSDSNEQCIQNLNNIECSSALKERCLNDKAGSHAFEQRGTNNDSNSLHTEVIKVRRSKRERQKNCMLKDYVLNFSCSNEDSFPSCQEIEIGKECPKMEKQRVDKFITKNDRSVEGPPRKQQRVSDVVTKKVDGADQFEANTYENIDTIECSHQSNPKLRRIKKCKVKYGLKAIDARQSWRHKWKAYTAAVKSQRNKENKHEKCNIGTESDRNENIIDDELSMEILNVPCKFSIHETSKLNLRYKLPEVAKYHHAITNWMQEVEGKKNASIEAETFMKWVTEARNQLTNALRYRILKLKEIVKPIIMKCNVVTNVEEKYKLLTGFNLHTRYTEPYFLEPTYLYSHTGIEQTLIVDESGTVYNMFPYLKEEDPVKKWHCNQRICNVSNVKEIGDRVQNMYDKIAQSKVYDCLKYIVTEFDFCPKQVIHDDTHVGHPSICHTTNFGITDLAFLLNIAPHYPLIRSVLYCVYFIRKINLQLNVLMVALEDCDIDILNKFVESFKLNGKQFNIHCKTYHNETDINQQYKKGMEKMRKREENVPIYSCMSCDCLKPYTELCAVAKLKKPLENKLWEEMNVMTKKNKIPSEFICKYCLDYFRKGTLPPTCSMNELFIEEVPKEIDCLNQYEKLLIQRAKAFQVVTKMGTVSGKNKPVSILNQKVIGRTFHLPLPLQQTLAKLPKPNECLIPNQELYILVRGMPTNQRKMWQSLVSVTKVYHALYWLKEHNILYKDIVLPAIPEDLLLQLVDQPTRIEATSQYSNSQDEDDPNCVPSCSNDSALCNQTVRNVATPQIQRTSTANTITESGSCVIKLPPGYINRDNSCYANSVCQSLCSFDCITNHLDYIEIVDYDQNQDANRLIYDTFYNVVQNHIHYPNRLNDCAELRSALGSPFHSGQQQDADHFLGKMIDCCMFLKNIFLIHLLPTITCLNLQCGMESARVVEEDYCFRFSLPPIPCDINEIMRIILQDESNQQCSECHQMTGTKKKKLVGVPAIVVCQIGMYDYQTALKWSPQRYIKNLHETNLVLNERIYQLQSVIYHLGKQIHQGHYTCGIRSHQNSWILANDTNVSIVPATEHCGDPYLLFYKLQSEETVRNEFNDEFESEEMLFNIHDSFDLNQSGEVPSPNLQFNEPVEDELGVRNVHFADYEHASVKGQSESILNNNLNIVQCVIQPECAVENCNGTASVASAIPNSDGNQILNCQQECNDNENICAAMLTQKNPEDEFYQHYTIHQLNESRINKDPAELYQMLKVMTDVIDNRDMELDMKCFPDLYPNGKNAMGMKRMVRLSAFEYSKLRMKSRNRRFRLNIQYLFFLLNLTNIRQLASGIYHKMSTGVEQMSAKQFVEKMKNRELDESLCNIFAKLRNTAQYWYAPRQDVMTMINNYGPATFFLTLSPSEYDWIDLDKYLRKMNPEVSKGKSTSALIAMDPVSTSRFIDVKFHAVLDFITGENGPLGKITHYFWRREYQTRGLQHFHILLWAKDAPVIGEAKNADVAEFIAKYVTCALLDKHTFPILHERVVKYQTHRHNSYCMRSTKYNGKNIRVCRFSFPRPVTKSFEVRSVAQSIYGRRSLKPNSRLYDLPRTKDEENINDYNAPILRIWQGNMDIQVICEKSTILSRYITKYQTKEEKSYNSDIFSDINCNKTLGASLWSIGMRSLSSRECGALEAADTLLGHSLYGKDKDTVIRYINVHMIRQRKLKKMKDMERLDPDSTDIYCKNLVDTYYPDRPAVLENISLYDFAANYEIINKESALQESDNECGMHMYKFKHGFLKKRSKPYIIKHTIFSIKSNPENYFFSLLLLFKPWRLMSDLKGNYFTFTDAFNECKDELDNALEYHKKLQDVNDAREDIEKRVREMVQHNASAAKNIQTESQQNYERDEVADIMDEFRYMANQDDGETLSDLIAGLNEEQQEEFDKITSEIQTPGVVVRRFISGVGGTGKTHFIKVLVKWIRTVLKKDVAVCAPTGIAAYNVGGVTIHRLFRLLVDKVDSPGYEKLRDDVLKIVRAILGNTIMLIFDEVSMISNLLFLYSHFRATEAKDTSNDPNGWFGGMHALFFGDLFQLPPVKQRPVYCDLSTKTMHKYLKCLFVKNIWKDLISFGEFTINMRQKDDPEYAKLLNLIRLGITTKEHNKILLDKRIKFKSSTPDGRLEEICNLFSKLPKDTVCVLPKKEQCKSINEQMLERLPGNEICLVAHDDVPEKAQQSLRVKKALTKLYNDDDSDNTAGLERIVKIKLGAKVMVRRNVDVTLGLVNGAVGIVKQINEDPITKKYKSMIIEINGVDRELEMIVAKFDLLPNILIVRTQFPIILAYGITIHKCQGISLNNCIADVGEGVFECGQTYVALSRVRTLDGLTLINYNPCSVKASNSAIEEYKRLYKLNNKTWPIEYNALKKENSRYKIRDVVWTGSTIDKHLENIQREVAQPVALPITEVQPPLYDSSEATSSYATSLCQCLFNMNSVVNKIEIINELNDSDDELDFENIYGHKPLHHDVSTDFLFIQELKTLSAKHSQHFSNLTTVEIRKCLGGIYTDNKEHDVVKFLSDVLKHCAFLKNLTHIDSHLIDKCFAPNCGDTATPANKWFMLPLHVQQQKISLENLLQSSVKWDAYSKDKANVHSCAQCGEKCITKLEISSTSDILILEIVMWENMVDPAKVSISGVPRTPIEMNNTKYILNSALFETMEVGLDNTTSYYAMISVDKKWCKVSKDGRQFISWPNGSRNIKLLFYEKIVKRKKK